MSDYISREAAIDHIKRQQCQKCSDIGLCGNCAVLVAMKLLETVPTADVEPVRHGHWTGKKDNEGFPYFEHEECGKKYRLIGDLQYCPHYGAKMDLEGEQ